MMVWAVSNDNLGEQSLIAAAHDALVGDMDVATIASRAPGFDHLLGGDGQIRLSDCSQLA